MRMNFIFFVTTLFWGTSGGFMHESISRRFFQFSIARILFAQVYTSYEHQDTRGKHRVC